MSSCDELATKERKIGFYYFRFNKNNQWDVLKNEMMINCVR